MPKLDAIYELKKGFAEGAEGKRLNLTDVQTWFQTEIKIVFGIACKSV